MKYDIANLNETRPSRRSVVRTAAWSVPVIATAATAPAFAASCLPATVTAGNATAASRPSEYDYTVTFDSDGSGPKPANVMTVKATYDTGMGVRNDSNGGTNDNFTIQGSVGGLGTYGLVMAQRATGTSANANAYGHYKFTFTKPVSNLTFTLTDIDSTTGDFWDAVWLSGTFTRSNRATGMTGVGTKANPFRQSDGNTAINNSTGANGNVTITYPGPISEFTINYANIQTGTFTADPDQVVTIANFQFDYAPC